MILGDTTVVQPDLVYFDQYVVGDIDSQLNAPVHSGHKTVMATTEHRYIVRDDGILGGEPIVRGKRTPVRAIFTVGLAFPLGPRSD